MTDEVRFALQLGLSLAAVLLAGWLAGRYAARQVRQVLEAERQRVSEAQQQVQSKVMAELPPIPPEFEQLVEVERWVLTARDLQLILTSLGTLIRIRLRTDESSQPSLSAEIKRSLKHLDRQENKWLNASLLVVAYVRQLDPAKGKARDQTMESWISRLNQSYVQAAQSIRRAAHVCDLDGNETYDDSISNAYLVEADQATANMASMIASALDRVAYLRQQLPEYQAQRIAATVAERSGNAYETIYEDEVKEDAGLLAESALEPTSSSNHGAH